MVAAPAVAAFSAAALQSTVEIQAGQPTAAPIVPPVITTPAGAAAVEQTSPGAGPPAALVESFDGLGVGFTGPQGVVAGAIRRTTASLSDPTTSCRPSTRGWRSSRRRESGSTTTGRAAVGPVATNNVFKDFGGACETRNNGDAVVRYDQLADRWLIVMPIFARGPARPDQPADWKSGEPAHVSPPGRPGQPGRAVRLFEPPPPTAAVRPTGTGNAAAAQPPRCRDPYSMCYAISVGPIRSGRTTATSSCGRSFRTTRVRRFGPTATTCRPAPATTIRTITSRSTRASSIAPGC